MTLTVVGHRGAGHLAPENTLASFALAERLGVDELELDLRLSADDGVVVVHDSTVDRTTGGSGEVAQMTVAELQGLEVGEGERIPTFFEVLEATSLPLQVEIKDPAVLGRLAELLRGAAAERPRITLTTFDVVVAAQLKEVFPDIPVGLIVPTPTEELLELAVRQDLSGVFGRVEHLWPEFVTAARARGMRVDAWPVNTSAEVHRAEELGVDGVTTDDPHVLV